jgi:molybdopterin molybdotransferase
MLVRLEEARRILERAHFRTPGVVEVSPAQGVGRLAGRTLRAARDLPETDVSAMDGFAVRTGSGRTGTTFALRGPTARSGARSPPLAAGEAVAISTGARLPPGANAIVRVESTQLRGGFLHSVDPVRRGQDIIPRGESIRRGEVVVERGAPVRPYHLSVLLADGGSRLPVFKVRVAILPIGNEIRGAGRPRAGTVRDIIGPVCGRLLPFAHVRYLPAVRDDPRRLRAVIEKEARRSDLLLTIGGSSVGRDDVTKRTLTEMGEILFEGVQANVLKRGAVAQVNGMAVLVLPGQVVSAVTVLHEHGFHVVSRMVGHELRRFDRVRLSTPVPVNHHMDSTFLFRVRDGRAVPLPWGVARLQALMQANAFGVLARGHDWNAGDEVRLQRLELDGPS